MMEIKSTCIIMVKVHRQSIFQKYHMVERSHQWYVTIAIRLYSQQIRHMSPITGDEREPLLPIGALGDE